MSTGVVPGKAVAAAPVGSLGGGLDLLPWPKVDFAKFGEIESSRCRASRRSPARTSPATGR
jgi:hypothetical protein